ARPVPLLAAKQRGEVAGSRGRLLEARGRANRQGDGAGLQTRGEAAVVVAGEGRHPALNGERVQPAEGDIQSVGGCQPASTQWPRTTSASGSSLRCKAATVARPTGVKPMMVMPSSPQRK